MLPAQASAEELRMCDAAGTELLLRVDDPTGDRLTSGPIPPGSVLTIPAVCPAGEQSTCYLYFDNPDTWPVPDFLQAHATLYNGGVESGEGDTPTAWTHDRGDEQHRAAWSDENPHSGDRCLKTVVAEGVEPTWIATRQANIHCVGGQEYEFSAWVKAQDVVGYAGWYLHVGNAENSMLIAPMLQAGDGTFGWREVRTTFTTPEGADRISLGTVLRGTGIAWFDDAQLLAPAASLLLATPRAPERLDLAQVGAEAPWYDDDLLDDIHWDCRAPVRMTNLSDRRVEGSLALVDMARLNVLMRGRLRPESLRVTADGQVIPHQFLGDRLAFAAEVAAESARTYYLYLSEDEGIPAAPAGDFAGLLHSPANLAANPDFESGDDLPDHWPGGAEGQRPAGAEMSFDSPGLFGERCLRLHIPHDAEATWTGWRQMVPVEPGRSYVFAAWVRTEDIRGAVRLHAHYRNADGELCEARKHTSAGPELTGTTDWTLLSGTFTMPPDAAFFELHLTMNATGTVWHDGALLAEASETWVGELQAHPVQRDPDLAIWPVNALVKVFRDDMPPREIPPASISAARNEREPLQLLLRCRRGMTGLRAVADAPVNGRGETLPAPEINVVGYVPVDHATSYYSIDVPDWQRKFPTAPGRCDGWAGWWPDPLASTDSFDLQPDQTQPIWLTVAIPDDARPGDYRGVVSLTRGDQTVVEAPYAVHVWDFALPDHTDLKAIYDLRASGPMWQAEGQTRLDAIEESARFMRERRTCGHRLFPDPIIKYENGLATADFTEFDEAARYWFDELDLPHSYTPWYFYGFGWGHPPRNAWGEPPYEGQYPYENADRTNLRPEYKRAYQACLKVYWDHLKEMGWADRFALYISDEPYDRHDYIIDQMRALCDMIHEVDAEIPIYCSTWRHIPEWDGYLDIWGLGHDGRVPPEQLAKLRAAGDRIWWTTDGQMCIDTPYCAVERLLPHYCLKYDAEAYEFWGVDWLTYDPWQFGWHRFISQSSEPGKQRWVRYPNGDGFLMYPGAPIGHDGRVSSIRLEQAREGVEDYEYLSMLKRMIAEAKANGRDVAGAEAALALASGLVEMPNAGGRYSTRILPDPDAVFEVKRVVAEAIEGLR
jgi:hypothetical protein